MKVESNSLSPVHLEHAKTRKRVDVTVGDAGVAFQKQIGEVSHPTQPVPTVKTPPTPQTNGSSLSRFLSKEEKAVIRGLFFNRDNDWGIGAYQRTQEETVSTSVLGSKLDLKS